MIETISINHKGLKGSFKGFRQFNLISGLSGNRKPVQWSGVSKRQYRLRLAPHSNASRLGGYI